MYFLHAKFVEGVTDHRGFVNKSAETLICITEMSAVRSWHLDCSTVGGARDTGDDYITSCSRFLVTVVRTVTGNKGDAVFPRCVASFFSISCRDHCETSKVPFVRLEAVPLALAA